MIVRKSSLVHSCVVTISSALFVTPLNAFRPNGCPGKALQVYVCLSFWWCGCTLGLGENFVFATPGPRLVVRWICRHRQFMLNTGLRLGQSDGLVQGYYRRNAFVFNKIRTLSGFGFTAAAVVAAQMCYHLPCLVVFLIFSKFNT